MGIQINTQPQTFSSPSTVLGSTGLSAVSGLTVYGDISASGTLYGTASNVMLQNVITGNGGVSYTLTNFTNNNATNYLVFLDGVKQRATTDYSISGSTITFTAAVPSGVVIEVNVPQNISSLSGGTVNSVGLSSDGSITIVSGSPVTTSGNVALKVGTVPLGSISNGGASAGQVLTYNGSTSTWVASAAPGASGSITSGTAVTLTNQTSVDFTGIPSTAKRITVMFSSASTNGSSPIQIQIGASSIQTTGYASVMTSAAGVVTSSTAGFLVVGGPSSNVVSGIFTICSINASAFAWVGNGSAKPALNTSYYSAGDVSLSGILDRVRITTVNGTDQFDAGTVNIMWE